MTIDVIHEGPISRVVFNNPPFNLMNIDIMDELVTAHREAAARPETRVILTTSAIEGVFSNGLDPAYVVNTPHKERPAIFRAVGRMIYNLFAMEKPHIAVVNGPAMAGGAILALTADFRYFDADHGRMSFSELKVGLPLPAAAIAAINCFCRRDKLREVVMGANMDAAAARETGLCDGMASGDDFRELVEKAAGRLARLSPTALAETKRNLRAEVLPKVAQLKDRGDEMLEYTGDDMLGEGLRAIMEKRFANFTR
ncbi:MAG: enoyl-CoA hydratase/isomerase family protein [Acidobacteriota bacterium]|nr:enoyl-CoA hydratase/isomerase family protein [Acidobacteriota bacterium]